MILLYVSSLTCSIFALPQNSYNQQPPPQQQQQQSFNQHQHQNQNHNQNHQHQVHHQFNAQSTPNNNNYQAHAGHNNKNINNNNYNPNNNPLPVQALHSGNSNALSQSQYPIPPPAPPSLAQQQQPPQQSQKLLQQAPQTYGQKLQQQAYLQNQQKSYFQQQQQQVRRTPQPKTLTMSFNSLQFQNSANRNQVPITSYNNELSPDGTFAYGYTTGDGQQALAQGYTKNLGNKDLEAQVVQGAYSYTSPDGTPISVKYLADENGFRAEGLHLPTPPPIPDAIARALQYIARVQATNPQLYQSNQGATQFSGQYNQLG